jgi:AraC-like DNA-binding protein
MHALEQRARVLLPPAWHMGASIPQSDLHALLEAAAEQTSDPHLGLSLGGALNEASFHLVGPMIIAFPTIGDAVDAMLRVAPQLRGGLELWSRRHDGRVHFGFHGLADSSPGARIEVELIVALLVHFAGRFAHDGDPPVEAHFAFPAPRDHLLYARALRGPVQFGAALHGVSYAASLDARRRVGADAEVPHRLAKLVEAAFQPLEDEGAWSDRVRVLLRRMPSPHRAGLNELSRALRTTARGLTRRLALEGETWSGLRDEVAFERARAMLVGRELGIREIAEALGYAELSSFYRAFRRWTGGLTPVEYRSVPQPPVKRRAGQ